MDEIQLLKSMWKSRTQRQTKLIVPKVTYENMTGSLNNEHWFFKVPYAYRDALDISYDKRIKEKKSYMLWTQGVQLSFKVGDSLISKDNKTSLQVKFANAMGWDPDKNEMYQGSIVFDEYDVDGHKYTKKKQHSCNQMEFLQILITGKEL